MVTGIRVVRNVLTGIDTDTVTSGALPPNRGGVTAVNGSSGSLVYTTAPTLSTATVSDTIYIGNITSNTSIYTPSSGHLGFRSNGVNTATITTSGLTVAGTVDATSYAGNGYGLGTLNIANIAGSLAVVNGGTGTTTSTGTAGNVVLSEGPILTNMVAKNALYIGTLASNTAVIDAGGGGLGFRANGVNTATLTTSGLDVAWNVSANALIVTSSAQTVVQTAVGASYGAWTSRTSAADNSWYSVCYGNGLYVAVAGSGTGNRVMTSPDGITWTIRTSAADNPWYGVCYGNGLFVAVSYSGTGNRVMTSPDGITWTLRTSAADNGWYSVCYGNGIYVAVAGSGTGNRVMTSPDGITWTLRTSAADNGWYSVCYGNGIYVAVAGSGTGNRVMTSPDGITWTSRTSAADNSWNGVCYGNGLFVAVSSTGSGNRVMSSPDGITWTSRTSAADNSWYVVCYGNGLFVAVSYTGSGNRVMTSPDGITWTSESTAASINWYGVCYGTDKFVAVAASGTGNRVMSSSYVPVPSLGLGKTPGTGYQLDLSLDTARKLTSTTWTTGSDRRIKEDIEDANLQMCCALVETIPLKRFAWKESYAPTQDDRHQLGWIAQDVEATGLEKAVTISEDHGYPDFRSLNTDQLYKIMWGALQHHMQDVKDIETRLR